MITRATCGAVMLAISVGAQADICRWTDATGAVHYGDHAPPNTAAHCDQTAPPKPSVAPIAPYQLDPEIAKIAQDLDRASAPYLDAKARFEATLSRARWFKARAGSP